MTASNPNVATNSLRSCAAPARAWGESANSGCANMRCATRYPDEGPDDLHHHVARHLTPGEAALPRIRERDRGIEVRTRDGSEGQNQRHQDGAGRQRVREEGDGDIPAREALAHDARADDAREQ